MQICRPQTVSILNGLSFTINMYERLSIDLRNTRIFGWEEAKSADVVDSLVRALGEGKDIPPIRVVKIDEATYEIADASKYDLPPEHQGGGHKRALAMKQRGTPLDAILVGHSERLRPDAINLEDIKLIQDSEIGENDLYRRPDGALLWVETLKTTQARDPNYR